MNFDDINDINYLDKLYCQYCDTTGMEKTSYTKASDKQKMLFTKWLLKNKERTEVYKYCLESLGIIPNKPLIELGKGVYDTLGLENARIVSPHADTLGKENSQILHRDGKLYIYTKRFAETILEKITDEVLIEVNPFTIPCADDRISSWARQANVAGVELFVGLHGNIHDKDYKKRLDDLYYLKHHLNGIYSTSHELYGDDYFLTLHKVKK